MMDWTEVSAIAAVAGVAIVLGGHAIAYGHFRAKADTAKSTADAAMKKASETSEALAKFREEVAKEYVTAEALGRIEGQIQEVGREMRSGLDDLRNKIIEFFTRVPESRKS